jgi:hypothetical protein
MFSGHASGGHTLDNRVKATGPVRSPPQQPPWPSTSRRKKAHRPPPVRAPVEHPRRGRSRRRGDRGNRSTLRKTGAAMRTAVITTVHGRHEHLRRQIAGLRRSSWPADMHVVVALADPMIRGVVASTNSPAVVADCDYANGQLPVAQARNIGATAALRGGAELLVFLDVDCIPGANLIGRYHRAATRHEHAQALLCGPVTYLPPPDPQGYALNQLSSQLNPHPDRPAPPDDDIVASTDYGMFPAVGVRQSARFRDGIVCACPRNTAGCAYGMRSPGGC